MIKLLTNKMHGILPLTENTLSNLQMKHPTAQRADPDVLLPDEPYIVYQIHYACIDAEAVTKAVIRRKGGSDHLELMLMDGEEYLPPTNSKKVLSDYVNHFQKSYESYELARKILHH